MKRNLAIIITLLFANSFALGQSTTPKTATPIKLTAAGAKAMLFSFSGFSTLNAGNFDGGFGAKYYLTDMLACRVGLQLAKADENFPVTPPSGLRGKDGQRSATRAGISAALELHRAAGRVSAFIGGGAGFSKTSTENKEPVIGTPPLEQITIKNDDDGEMINGVTYWGGTSWSAFALTGVEFFLFSQVSLAAEYRLAFTKMSRADQVVQAGKTTVTTKLGSGSQIDISNGGALTLAVYFK